MTPRNRAACAGPFWGLIAVIAFIALLLVPPGAPLRNPETGAIIGDSPFMYSLIVSISALFFADRLRPTASAPAR